MPRQISDEKRRAIIADLDNNMTLGEIAKKQNVAKATVWKYADEIGHTFDRSATKIATAALVFDAKAARAQLVVDLYRDAQRFRDRAWSRYEQVLMGREGAETISLEYPPLREQQAGYTALAICLDKAAMLERADDSTSATARTMVGDLFGALALSAGQILKDAEKAEPE